MQFDGQCFNFIEFEHIDYKATLKPLVSLKNLKNIYQNIEYFIHDMYITNDTIIKISYKYIIVAWTINCNSCACLGKHFW